MSLNQESLKETRAESGGNRRRPWYGFAALPAGKLVRLLSRLTHHGGSALPGRIVERIDPTFLARTLASLPQGVVLISGTNGKTTTTRMVSSMLQSMGLKVFTNPTGSNFTRGIVSALVEQMSVGSAHGKIPADIAVLELDEAYAVHFVRQVHPRYALLLNVMRDQLDRFGEIDNTARLLSSVAATTSGTLVLNREDPRIAELARQVSQGTQVHYFGLDDSLLQCFPSDDEMHEIGQIDLGNTLSEQESSHSVDQQKRLASRPQHSLQADVVLKTVGDHYATFLVDGQEQGTTMQLEGVYNLYNAAAALALVRAVLESETPRVQRHDKVSEVDSARSHDDSLPLSSLSADVNQQLMRALSQVTPAFGRGEVITYQGASIELILVKNPMGFRLALSSFQPANTDTMIAIRDEYADGRDMSWLWDVDFSSLRSEGVSMVSGTRAYDMALRLQYDKVNVGRIEPDLSTALHEFVVAHPGRSKRIYCTYTAMLNLRTELGKITQVSEAGVGA